MWHVHKRSLLNVTHHNTTSNNAPFLMQYALPFHDISMPKDHWWMASTGLNGTTTSLLTMATSLSSTMRTCFSESLECASWRSWITRVTSTRISKMKSLTVLTCTVIRRKMTKSLVSSMGQRESNVHTCSPLHLHIHLMGHVNFY